MSVCIERLHAARISLLEIAEQITLANRGKRTIIDKMSEAKTKFEFPSNFLSEANSYPVSISYPTPVPDPSHITVDTSSRSGCPHLLLPPVLAAQRSSLPCAVTAVYTALLDAPLSTTLLSKSAIYILEYVQLLLLILLLLLLLLLLSLLLLSLLLLLL